MKLKVHLLLILPIPLLFFISCDLLGIKSDDDDDSEDKYRVETRVIEGIVTGYAHSTIPVSDLQALSFANLSDIEIDGRFEVEAPETQRYQTIIISDSETQNPVYLGLFDPVTETFTANDTTTAISLALMNPYLLLSEQSIREEFVNELKNQSKFQSLLHSLQFAYTKNAKLALDYDENNQIYQLVAELIIDTFEALSEQNKMFSFSSKDVESSEPHIINSDGDAITFVNPRHAWYAASINKNTIEHVNTISINRKEKLISFGWSWPPAHFTENALTDYNLGDGYFKIDLAKGFSFRNLTDLNDPVSLGTLLNTGQVIIYTIDLVVGFLPAPNIINLPNHLSITEQRARQIAWALANRETKDLILTFLNLILDNVEGISYWIWQETQNNAQHQFLSSAAGILGNVAIAFKILGLANDQVPFYWDLISAPNEITYFITQNNGEITSVEENNPPIPVFSVNPPAGIIGTEFTFDASSTSDDNDQLEELNFRWDFYNNGNWDVDWTSEPVVKYIYNEENSYSVVMEVMDTGGLVNSTTKTVNVGGGSNSANRVKLFKDNLPWESSATIQVLESLGFSEGIDSDYQYQIIPSSEMRNTQLIPGEDLVIISNDQMQSFYDNYADNQIKFNNFVFNGGSIFWGASDLGWAGGSISEAGVSLPGNIGINFNLDNYNYVVDQNFPLVSGLPDVLDHNFASHESFSNLPEGTIVYTVNSDNEPTLIEYNFGEGWVLVTGQPLEHQYGRLYGEANMGELLPRIITYFTGQSINKKFRTPALLQYSIDQSSSYKSR